MCPTFINPSMILSLCLCHPIQLSGALFLSLRASVCVCVHDAGNQNFAPHAPCARTLRSCMLALVRVYVFWTLLK